MKNNQFDLNSLPDIVELRKQLSEANKLRHQFWTQLRAVRHQIIDYIKVHEFSKKEFEKEMKSLSPEAKEYYKAAWEIGKNIPLGNLRKMQSIIKNLYKESQSGEELTRKLQLGAKFIPPLKCRDDFFKAVPCVNCKLPIPSESRRTKFCSDVCNDQYRKRNDQRKRREKNKNKLPKPRIIQQKTKSSVNKPNPQSGKGNRKDNCKEYDTCLKKTVESNWPYFNCENCGLY